MNKATKIIVATLGVIFGISGISHGLFETFQGNTPTGGLFISAIGEAYKMWPYGFVPAVNDPGLVVSIMLLCIAIGYGCLLLTFVAGFAHDMAMRPDIVPDAK
jgi:vacuolar-type H+-ATPase subunit I/STV1